MLYSAISSMNNLSKRANTKAELLQIVIYNEMWRNYGRIWPKRGCRWLPRKRDWGGDYWSSDTVRSLTRAIFVPYSRKCVCLYAYSRFQNCQREMFLYYWMQLYNLLDCGCCVVKFDPPSRFFLWRRGGLMVSALVSASSGPGSISGWGHCVVFLCSSQCLSPPRSDLRWTSILSRGSRNTPSRFMLQKLG